MIHLIERVSKPGRVYSDIRAVSPAGGTILDFSAGRVGAVSTLDADSLPDAGIYRWVPASRYETLLADETRKEYVRLTHEIGAKPVYNGQNIKDLLAYDGEFSAWWLSETSQKHAINFPLRWCVYCCSIIDHMLDTGEIEDGYTWNIWVPTITIGDLYKQAIGSRGNVEIRIVGKKSNPEAVKPIGPTKANIYALFVVVRAFLLSITHKLFDRTKQNRIYREDGVDNVLVVSISDTGWKKAPDPESHESKIEFFDTYMGYMPWDIDGQRIRTSWVRSSIARKGYLSWRRKCENNTGMRDASGLAVLGPVAALRVLMNVNRIIARYNRLLKQSRNEALWSHRDVVLDALVHRDLRFLCGRMLVNHMVRFEQYRRAVESMRPRAVLYKSEMFIPGRLITAAMRGRTRLIALQHGIHITEALPYQFDPRDVADGDQVDHVRFCPMPDVFAAFGEYAREQFAKWGGYDAAKVVPIGGVRHDHLVRTLYAEGGERRELQARLRGRLGLPNGARVILLCTQQRQDVGSWFDLVLQGLKASSPDAFVAVQLHHAHGGADQIHDLAEKHGFAEYRIFDASTYPLIAGSDVVVTGPSTIVLESILLGTPAISIAATESYETYPYQREELARIVSTPSEMEVALGELLGEGASPAATANRLELLRRHLWNDDAGACARLLELIYAPGGSFLQPRAAMPSERILGSDKVLTVDASSPSESASSRPRTAAGARDFM